MVWKKKTYVHYLQNGNSLEKPKASSNSTHHSVNSQLPKPVACEEPKRTPFYTDILQTRTQQLLQGY